MIDISIGFSAPNVPIFRNVLTYNDEITLTHVRDNATADYIGQQNRNAQAINQIYQCLRKYATQDIRDHLVTEDDAFHIEGKPDGPAFFMTLIDVYSVRTTATSTTVLTKIDESHLLIVELEYDVDTFNTLVESLVKKLSANG